MVDRSAEEIPFGVRGRREELSRRKALLETGAAALLSLPGVASAAESGRGGAIREDADESAKTNQISMTGLSYREIGACPKNLPVPPRAGPWECIEITATATNVGRRKNPKAANVFGTMFDAEGNSPLSVSLDPTQKFGIQILDGPFPQNQPREVKFPLVVQARAPRPFRFAAWKADYQDAGTARISKPFSDCEIDSELCAEGEEQPENAQYGYEGKGNTYRVD
jgi:hypothetical protein